MITFLTRTMRQEPLLILTRDWARALDGRVRLLEYAQLSNLDPVNPGAYVFTGVDEIVGPERELACQFARRLQDAGPAFRVLNDPHRALPRYELLRALQEAGINRFRAYRLDELPERLERPVFVRRDRAHTANLTEPIDDIQTLHRCLRKIRWSFRRFPMRDLIAVEFLQTRCPDGLYRKYAATRLGDRLVARHLLVSGNWVTKFPDRVDEAVAAEECRFLHTFPRRDEVMAAFQIAGLEYGRIDYGLVDGQIQVWEINSNPLMSPPMHRFAQTRRRCQRHATRKMIRALQDLAVGADAAPIPGVFGPSDGRLVRSVQRRAAIRRAAVKTYRRLGIGVKG